MKEQIQAKLHKLMGFANKDKNPYLISIGLLILGSVIVYLSPRSIPGFLLFVFAASSIYWLNLNKAVQLALAVFVAIILIPILGARNVFYLEVIFQIAVFSALALGLNIVVGFSGLLNFGYMAFYAVGAYLWGFFGSQQPYLLNSTVTTKALNTPFFMAPDWFYLFIFLGVIVAAVLGLVLGLPVLRVRGDYLAVISLAFGEIVRQLANNLDKPWNLTNGPQGITPIQRPTMPKGILHMFNSVFDPVIGHRITENQAYNILFYMIALLVVVAVIVITYRLDDSKVGRAWTAVREDELSAGAMGINANKLKLGAFTVGASFAGAMGVLFAASRTFVSPETFTFLQSVGVLTMVILGGIGSITGVIVGATVVTLLNIQVLQSFSLYLSQLRQSDAAFLGFHWKNLSNQLDPAKYQRLIFGIVLVVMMIYRPAGLIPRPGANENWMPNPMKKISKGKELNVADSKYILTSDKVVKRFGGLTAVNKMTVNIERGRIVSIIGPNGAGKTTFFNAISSLYHCEEGAIEFEGTRIEKMHPYEITSLGMARTFQNIRLFSGMTVVENIMVGAYTRLKQNPIQAVFRTAAFKEEEKMAQGRAQELMEYVGLKNVGNELAGSLPYGAQRRVEIARALASQPKLLLLDEPAAGMNPSESEHALNLFRRIRDELGITILLIEHDMKVVMNISEHIYVMDHGEQIAEGLPKEIASNPQVIEAYLGKGAAGTHTVA